MMVRTAKQLLLLKTLLWHTVFYYWVQQFIETFYVDILGTTDYWLRYEWQHRRSLHIHGLAWLRNAPNAEEILTPPDNYLHKEELLRFVDSIACTCNPAVSPDGSNLDDAPLPRTNPYICSHPYSDIHDYQQYLIDLVATCKVIACGVNREIKFVGLVIQSLFNPRLISLVKMEM